MPFYLKSTGKGEIELKQGKDLVPGSKELLVKVICTATNPTDWQQAGAAPNIGSTIGYEFAGIVEALGPDSTKFHVGSRVAGFTFGNCPFNTDYGAFGEYALGFEHITFAVPDDMSFEEAVTLPTALMVVVQSLYQALGLPKPGSQPDGKPFLINGGSTAMGVIALQFASLSGVQPLVATASAKHFDFLKALGADEVFDYHDEDFAAKVKKYTSGKLTRALDAASVGSSAKLTAECLGEAGGKVVVLNPAKGDERTDVEFPMTLTMTAIGYAFKLFDFEIPENPTDKEFMTEFWENTIHPLLAARKIKPNNVKVVPGGLHGVKDGWKLMQDGKVSCQKLVHIIGDTPGL